MPHWNRSDSQDRRIAGSDQLCILTCGGVGSCPLLVNTSERFGHLKNSLAHHTSSSLEDLSALIAIRIRRYGQRV